MNDPLSPADLETALRVLRWGADDVAHGDDLIELKTLVAKISRSARLRLRRASRDAEKRPLHDLAQQMGTLQRLTLGGRCGKRLGISAPR